MTNYFRITAYHPEKDISVILDSNGVFEKLWMFSSYLVQRGFKILEVGANDNIIECEQIILLNGFVKKSTKDYKKEINKARQILDTLCYENEN